MSDRNKIAQALTVEQLDEFIRELAAMPGKERTLEAIKRHAAARGISISIESAKSFRETTFKRHLDRLSKAQELATQVAAMQQQGAGNTLADASAAILSQQIFDLLEETEELNLKDAGKLAFIISKMRQGDVASRALQLKLDEAERRERERQEKNEQAAAQLRKLREPGAEVSDAERVAILDEVDRLMGVKK